MKITLRTIVIGITWFLLGFISMASASALAAGEAPPKDTLRPEVGNPLKAAQDLTKAKRMARRSWHGCV